LNTTLPVKTLVLVPSYNEESNLPRTLTSLLDVVTRDDVLVIDDGSSDRTSTIARQAGVNLLRNQRNIGRNSSVVRGMSWGLKRGYSLIICVDADGQHPVKEIPRMVRRFCSSPSPDCIIMSRFLMITRLRTVPKVDALGILVSSFLVSMSAGRHISDPTSGYIAFSPRAAQCLIQHVSVLRSIVSDNTWAMGQYPLFTKYGLYITELGTRYIPRRSGKRKMFSPSKRILFPLRLLRAFLTIRLTLATLP